MDRLDSFENVLEEILTEYKKIGQELELLRKAQKMKTTKFRELLGKKLVYRMILDIFIQKGLLEEGRLA